MINEEKIEQLLLIEISIVSNNISYQADRGSYESVVKLMDDLESLGKALYYYKKTVVGIS